LTGCNVNGSRQADSSLEIDPIINHKPSRRWGLTASNPWPASACEVIDQCRFLPGCCGSEGGIEGLTPPSTSFRTPRSGDPESRSKL